jgi:hypothetical protein
MADVGCRSQSAMSIAMSGPACVTMRSEALRTDQMLMAVTRSRKYFGKIVMQLSISRRPLASRTKILREVIG